MKKLRVNPILRKELRIGSRSIKTCMAIMGVNLGLSLIVFIVMASLSGQALVESYNYSALVMVFPYLAVLECVVVSFMVPILTSGSISGERERQTLDIMLTTPLKTFSIAIGKLESVVVIVMMYLISAIPVMAVSFILGGLSWSALFWQIVLMLYISVYVGSIGIFCSSFLKRSLAASALTILIEMAIGLITLIVFFVLIAFGEMQAINHNRSFTLSWQALILTVNPYVPFVEFMLQTFSGNGLADLFERAGCSKGWETIYRFWVPLSGIINLGISIGFLKLGANCIGVTHNRRKKK